MSESPKGSPGPAYHVCPTCGSTLLVAHSDEGTAHFVSLDIRQSAGLQTEVASLRESLARIVAGSIRSRPQAAIDELREIARDALAADPGQAAERVRLLEVVVDALSALIKGHDELLDNTRMGDGYLITKSQWEQDAQMQVCRDALAALATPGKAQE